MALTASLAYFVRQDHIEQIKLRQELESLRLSKAPQTAREAAGRVEVVATAVPAPAPVPTPVAVPAPGSDHVALMAAAGIAVADYASVDYIVSHESGWNPSAVNPSSGSCSLVQALPCSKIGGDWQNPVTALSWANGYVSRYGGWAGAEAFWRSHAWY